MTNAEGGIFDDLVVTRWAEDSYFLVVNASRKDEDLRHLREHLPDFTVEHLEDYALLALQGPRAIEVMEELSPDAANLLFMNSCHTSIGNIECFISRSGYTGEDGFEISVSHTQVRNSVINCWPVVLSAGLGWARGIPCGWRPDSVSMAMSSTKLFPRCRRACSGPSVNRGDVVE